MQCWIASTRFVGLWGYLETWASFHKNPAGQELGHQVHNGAFVHSGNFPSSCTNSGVCAFVGEPCRQCDLARMDIFSSSQPGGTDWMFQWHCVLHGACICSLHVCTICWTMLVQCWTQQHRVCWQSHPSLRYLTWSPVGQKLGTYVETLLLYHTDDLVLGMRLLPAWHLDLFRCVLVKRPPNFKWLDTSYTLFLSKVYDGWVPKWHSPDA